MSTGASSFLLWLQEVVQPQASPHSGNTAVLDDFSPDGIREYRYPKEFMVSGDAYMWSVSSAHTKGRHLCTHCKIWFFGPAFDSGQRIATGGPIKAKMRRNLRKIHDYYYEGNSNENDPAHFSV